MVTISCPTSKARWTKGHQAAGKTFKVHLDGYNFVLYLTGQAKEGPRREFFYWTDDGALTGLRYNDWKAVFMEQRAHGLNVWQEPLVPLRLPKIFNLRRDPFERADHEAQGYDRWRIEHLYALYGAQALTAKFVSSFKDFPPRQRPASFAVDQIMEKFMKRHGQ